MTGEVDIKALVVLLDEVRKYLPIEASESSPLQRTDTLYMALSSLADAGVTLVVARPVDAPSQEDVDVVVAGVRRYGGSFAQALAAALQLADSDNRRRIRSAFQELWDKYHDFGKIAAEMDKRAAEELGK